MLATADPWKKAPSVPNELFSANERDLNDPLVTVSEQRSEGDVGP